MNQTGKEADGCSRDLKSKILNATKITMKPDEKRQLLEKLISKASLVG